MGTFVHTPILDRGWNEPQRRNILGVGIPMANNAGVTSTILDATSPSTTVARSTSSPRITANMRFTTLVARGHPNDPSRTLLASSSLTEPSSVPSHIPLGTRPIKESAAIGITFLIIALAVVLTLLGYFLWRRRTEGKYPFTPRPSKPQDITITKDAWLYDAVPSPALSQVAGESDGLIPVSMEMTTMPASQKPPDLQIQQDPNLLSPLSTPRLSGARYSGPGGQPRASEIVLGGAWAPPTTAEKDEKRQLLTSSRETR